ncbi:MAG: ATP-dependent DNA helicase [Candidatus Nanoarchaeia archaeon]|jgi:DNA excision repair protein ERCC-2
MTFDYKSLYFPYEQVRAYQDLLIQNISASIDSRKSLLVHAPTGLGKTVASLAPAIYHALKKDLSIFFLTPRHTQHRLVIDTIKEISSAYGIKVPVVDLVGKQSNCPMPPAKELGRNDFLDYCKDLRNANKCPYYNNTRKTELTEKATRVIAELSNKPALHSEELCIACADNKLCPYETAIELGKRSKVIVCDYFHLFSDHVRSNFLAKINKELDKSILIIDEGHNLPDRVRSLMSHSLSTFTINSAVKELELFAFDDEASLVKVLSTIIDSLMSRYDREGLVSRDDLLKELESKTGLSYDELIESLSTAGLSVREEKQRSFTLAIARFLESWKADESDRVRVVKREFNKYGPFTSLSCYCLNPSQYTEPVFTEAYSTIIMSGTLTPTKMYAEVLGVSNNNLIELKSPFPQENRLTLVVPETTTRYAKRSDAEYHRIARKLESVINNISVSTAVFFPSYMILNQVLSRLKLPGRNIVVEEQGLSKEAKNSLLYNFRTHRGSILLGVVSGNFGEGVDLPGDELECIIIVGLPLAVPDLFTKSLINYYDNKFKKGWDYGYIYPALTKVIQSAGRCIRQSTDKGLIILLDERYAQQNYLRCIPPEWLVKVTKTPERLAKEFFG